MQIPNKFVESAARDALSVVVAVVVVETIIGVVVDDVSVVVQFPAEN